MKIGPILAYGLQRFFLPQECVLCGAVVCNPDFSPLCPDCLSGLERLKESLCTVCGIPLPGNILASQALCSGCRKNPPPFFSARAYGPYRGNLRRVLRQFKFHNCQRLAVPLSGLLTSCLADADWDLDPGWIIPVPLHWMRRRSRGFDQTRLLARSLARRLRLPLFRGLRRSRQTLPQSGLSARRRRQNLRNAFSLKNGDLLADADVLLVDDVMTTGSTVREISTLLKAQSSVGRIGILTIARVPGVRFL